MKIIANSILIYLLGYIVASLILSHQDFQKSLDIYEQETGMRPNYAITSWYWVYQSRNWIWKNIKHEFYKIYIKYLK